MTFSSTFFKRPETIFLLIASLIGIVLCFLIPPGAGFDEITHLARVWETSGGYMIPNQKLGKTPYLPMAFVEVSYRTRLFNTPIESDYFNKFAETKIDWNDFTNHRTRSVYFPLSYLPQAFAAGLLGRVFSAPVLWIYYLCRLLETLTYILMVYFAIRLIPFGKWVMATLALAPMALFQASTISTDPYTNAIGFLFIGWILAVVVQERQVSWKQAWLTLLMMALLFAGKPNTAFLILLMALLPWRKMPARMSLFLAAGTLVLFGLIVVGWNVLIYSDFYANVPGYGVSGQLANIFTHPFAFLNVFFNDIVVHGPGYLKEWIGVYGYNTGRVPDVVYPLFALLLFVVLLLDVPDRPIERRTRLVLLLTFLAGYIFTVVALYLTTNKIGSPFLEGVQGRYFIIVAPLLFLGLLPDWPILRRPLAPALIFAGGSLAVLVFYCLGVYATYYVTCGTSYYTPGLCYQPLYRNWDPDAQFTPPVQQGVTLTQSFTAVCAPLRSLRVWAGNPTPGAGQSTTYILRDAVTQTVLASQSLPNEKVPGHAWLEVAFPPVPDAPGKQYIIEITSPDSGAANALDYGITARREYDGGVFQINHQPQEADLLFQYGCDH
jgi:uncharacterized membrane protein